MGEGDNRLPLPRFEAVVAWHQRIVLVHLASPLPPIVKSAYADSQPADQLLRGQLCPAAPSAHRIDDFAPRVVYDPTLIQSRPSTVHELHEAQAKHTPDAIAVALARHFLRSVLRLTGINMNDPGYRFLSSSAAIKPQTACCTRGFHVAHEILAKNTRTDYRFE